MAEADTPTVKKPPKGGRKGGTLFPKINLKQAVNYSKKLVSKTHTGPQPETTILPGVFGNAGPNGKVRASALKQFGLLEGEVDAYKASELAREIDAAPEEDRSPLLQRAFLSSKLFSQIFETYHDDTVSKAKIEQRAKGLKVHPDSAEECTQLFMESAVTAGLGTLNGDPISLVKTGQNSLSEYSGDSESVEDETQQQGEEDVKGQFVQENTSADKNGRAGSSEKKDKQGAKSGVTLTLTVDPSSDPDKLEKQLKLLRQYGVI